MSDNDNKESHSVNGLTKSPISPDQDAKVFADIFINSPIGIYIVQDGKFVFMNPEFLRIGGFDEKELLGTDSLGIVLPEDREKVRRCALDMLKGKSHSPYEHRVMTKDGEIRWILETVTSIQFKGKRAVLGYFMDHTEHERAKEALNISEDKFHKAFRSSPDWFVISTLEDGFYEICPLICLRPLLPSHVRYDP